MAGAERKSLEPYLKDSVEFFEHQTDGIRRAARMPSFLLADDMGLGKSLQALTVFCIDVKMGKAETLLIVCPVTLRDNWFEEVNKFTRLPVTLLGEVAHPTKHGQTKKLAPVARQRQLEDWIGQSGPRILICNYEQLVNPVHKQTLTTFRFCMTIMDEAHVIKNHKAKRTQAALAIRARRSGMLTGTPMLNHVDELWPILHRIDPVRFPRPWAFINRFCAFGGYENRQIVGVKNPEELQKILAGVMIRRLKNDVLSREAPTYIKHLVGLSAKQRELYDLAAADPFFFEEEDGTDEDGNKKDGGALLKFLRLKQICTTPYAIDTELGDDSLKLDRLQEIAAELAERDDKLVVFTQFRGAQEAIMKRFAKANYGALYQLHGDVPQKERQPTVARWGAVRGASIIVCMTQVAGVGLNMVAASECTFVDRLFVPGLNKQAVDRLDRIGQERPVVVHELVARNTIESRIEEILGSKEMLNQDIVEGGAGMSTLIEMLRKAMKDDL
jgi:SNF2 family DNA or RNA helicase